MASALPFRIGKEPLTVVSCPWGRCPRWRRHGPREGGCVLWAPAIQSNDVYESTKGGCVLWAPQSNNAVYESTAVECLVKDLDDDVLSENESENLKGIWGNFLTSRNETDDEDERPKKRVKLNESASADAIQILHTG